MKMHEKMHANNFNFSFLFTKNNTKWQIETPWQVEREITEKIESFTFSIFNGIYFPKFWSRGLSFIFVLVPQIMLLILAVSLFHPESDSSPVPGKVASITCSKSTSSSLLFIPAAFWSGVHFSTIPGVTYMYTWLTNQSVNTWAREYSFVSPATLDTRHQLRLAEQNHRPLWELLDPMEISLRELSLDIALWSDLIYCPESIKTLLSPQDFPSSFWRGPPVLRQSGWQVPGVDLLSWGSKWIIPPPQIPSSFSLDSHFLRAKLLVWWVAQQATEDSFFLS